MKVVHLSRPLVLEGAVELADGMGGLTRSWGALGTLWAEVLPGTGRDVAGEEVVVSTVPYRITVRGAPQGAASRPQVGQRFRDGARVFAILAVTERDEDGRYLVCFVREEVLP
ncbi:head-tail adaptor [Pseudorhodobacter antarcticus]|jgi:head-tail adaptor|uniref:Head-tail adaptor n=1 Tax=Pseudorhodobacter antarcticus TaxID=1077947 RepID=A0A1H8D8L9_9RHOB|nr:head-tail adaptor protein [Pseudorhodobacter antarcticus]SEN03620.1 head-tail adaptor [Pseudorhodobacter antarcticus]